MAEAIVPIILLILTGVILKKINFVSEEAVSGMKSIATNICLPVVIFNALAMADFNTDSIFIVALSFFVLAGGFIAGYAIKRLYKKTYKDYIPFITVTFEGGMLGYALAELLVGNENLKYIATIDLGGALFSFTVWLTLLEGLGRDKPGSENRKNIFQSMFKSLTFDAAIIGLVVGVLGLGKGIMATAAGPVYSAVVDLFSAPLTPIILLSLGYGMNINLANVKDALVIIAQRLIVIGIFLALGLFIFGGHIQFVPELKASVILYFTLPPSFLLSVYVKDEKSRDVVSCVLSLYLMITFAVFCLLIAKKDMNF